MLAGLALGMVLLEISLRAGGMVYRSALERERMAKLSNLDELRILCIGESTTQGWGDNSWPRKLQERLDRSGYGRKIAVINNGVAAAYSSFLADQIEAWLQDYEPQIVISMVGINDDKNLLVSEEPSAGILRRSRWRSLDLVMMLSRTMIESRRPAPLRQRFATRQPKSPAPDSLREARRRREESQPQLSLDGYSPSAPAPERLQKLEAARVERPHDAAIVTELLRVHRGMGDRPAQIARLAELVQLEDPERAAEHAVELGELIWNTSGDKSEVAKAFRQALSFQPQHRKALVGLGHLYTSGGLSAEEARPLLQRAADLWPPMHQPAIWLSELEKATGHPESATLVLSKAEERMRQAIDELPQDRWRHIELARFFVTLGRKVDEIETYRAALAHNQDDPGLLRSLGDAYFDFKDYANAIETYKVVATYPVSDGMPPETDDLEKYAISLLLQHKQIENIKPFLEAMKLSLPPLNAYTARNYGRISEAIGKRGALHVAMQYPTMSVLPLMEMLKAAPATIFVDNERNFREALATHPYKSLFTDRFAYSWGHLTHLGNEMIAEQVERAIEPYLRKKSS